MESLNVFNIKQSANYSNSSFMQVQSARLAVYFKVHICTSGIVELFIILLTIAQNKAENLNVSSTQEDSEAQFIVPDWGDKVDYGTGLSYRQAT